MTDNGTHLRYNQGDDRIPVVPTPACFTNGSATSEHLFSVSGSNVADTRRWQLLLLDFKVL